MASRAYLRRYCDGPILPNTDFDAADDTEAATADSGSFLNHMFRHIGPSPAQASHTRIRRFNSTRPWGMTPALVIGSLVELEALRVCVE